MKQHFLDTYLTAVLRVRDFRNILAMRFNFIGKYSKFNLEFKTAEKNSEKVFGFRDNSISIGSIKLSLLRAEHLLSPVNLLTNSLKF